MAYFQKNQMDSINVNIVISQIIEQSEWVKIVLRSGNNVLIDSNHAQYLGTVIIGNTVFLRLVRDNLLDHVNIDEIVRIVTKPASKSNGNDQQATAPVAKQVG